MLTECQEGTEKNPSKAGTREIVQRVRCLPSTQAVRVQSLAPFIVLQDSPGVIPEHISRNKLLTLSGVTQEQKRKKSKAGIYTPLL